MKGCIVQGANEVTRKRCSWCKQNRHACWGVGQGARSGCKCKCGLWGADGKQCVGCISENGWCAKRRALQGMEGGGSQLVQRSQSATGGPQMYIQLDQHPSTAARGAWWPPHVEGVAVIASSNVFDGVRPPKPLAPILWPVDPHSIVAGADAAYWKCCCLLAALGGSNMERPPISSPPSPVVSSSGDSPIESSE